MVIHSNAIASLFRVSIVAHEDDDCVFAQTIFLQFVYHLPDVKVGCGNNRSVRSPCRIFHILIHRLMLPKSLLGVMRNVKWQIQEKRARFVFFNELQCTLHH